jgi:hypothetical protein
VSVSGCYLREGVLEEVPLVSGDGGCSGPGKGLLHCSNTSCEAHNSVVKRNRDTTVVAKRQIGV